MRCFIFLLFLLAASTSCGGNGAGGKLPTLHTAAPVLNPLTEGNPQVNSSAGTEPSGTTAAGTVGTGTSTAAPPTSPADAPAVYTNSGVHSSIGDDIPITRAAAAKMMALAYFSMKEIDGMTYSIPFKDVKKEDWHAKYINAVYSRQLMLGYNSNFLPDGNLTFGQAYELLSPEIEPPTADNIEMPVSYALWVDLYVKMLEDMGGAVGLTYGGAIESANIILMEYDADAEKPVKTDAGAFSCGGIDMRPYLDKELRALHKDGEIVAVTTLVNDIPTLNNAYILNADKYGATVFAGGTARYYEYGGDVSPLGKNEVIGDFVIYQGKILEMDSTGEKVSGKVLRTASGSIEIKDLGVLQADAKFKTYSAAEKNPAANAAAANAAAGSGVEAQTFERLLVGTEAADFYIKDNVLCAAVIHDSADTFSEPEKIRVAINTSGYGGLVHAGVSVTADTNFTVTAGKVEKNFKAGQLFTVGKLENADLFGQPRVFIECGKPDGLFQIMNLGRGADLPSYRGTLEIAVENGGYSVVNELPLEEYLYAVVPSEMPGGHGLESAKAQAVTARSYAYNQFHENRYHEFGAHVDDSVSSQVYNNIPETELSVQAVNETAGLCLTYLGNIISANFYSTSAGVTANSGEVWFGNETLPYLRSQLLVTDGASFGNLSAEESARKFLTDKNIKAFDSGFGWFRWEVEMTAGEIAASVNANLQARINANPELIVIEKGDAANGIGELISLDVLKRGEGGNIMEMRIEGTLAAVRALSEYNVRALICPKPFAPGGRDINIYRHDGTYVTNYSIMPSAFFVIENGANYKFVGGGNGHGVGMSQNGVKGMADLGFKFDEILEKFYPGTEVAAVM